MKTTMKLAAIAALALGAATMTSCNKSGGEPQRDEVQILTSVAGMTETRASLDPATGQGNLVNGDRIGLFVAREDDDQPAKFDYTVGTTKLYWDQLPPLTDENSTYYFYAVYPNVLELTGEQTLFFNAATAANPDLLVAAAEDVAKNTPVTLSFKHAMHRLIVKLTSNYYTTEQLSDAQVTPLLKSSASVGTEDGADPEGATQEGDSKYPAREGVSTSWIVAPQTLTPGGNMLSITVGADEIIYKVPAGLTVLESGRVLTLNLALNRDAVSLQGQNVSQWGAETILDETVPVQ